MMRARRGDRLRFERNRGQEVVDFLVIEILIVRHEELAAAVSSTRRSILVAGVFLALIHVVGPQIREDPASLPYVSA